MRKLDDVSATLPIANLDALAPRPVANLRTRPLNSAGRDQPLGHFGRLGERGNEMTHRVGLGPWLLAVALAALPLAGRPIAALAADLPADCSQATIPDQPAKGKIADKDFTPETATFSTINHPQIGGGSYDSFDLYLRGKDQNGGGMLLEINTIVPENGLTDGLTFTFLPTNDASKQPTVGPGAAGIQGWMLEDDNAGLNVDGSTEVASLRLQFGTRANDTLTGKVYFCAPGVKGSFVAGAFKVDVSSE